MFTVVVTGLLALIHLYIAWRSIHATAMRAPWRRRTGIALTFAWGLAVATLLFRRRLFLHVRAR